MKDKITEVVLNGVLSKQSVLVEKQIGCGYVANTFNELVKMGKKPIILDKLDNFDIEQINSMIKKNNSDVIMMDLNYQSTEKIKDFINELKKENLPIVVMANSNEINAKIVSLDDIPQELENIKAKKNTKQIVRTNSVKLK